MTEPRAGDVLVVNAGSTSLKLDLVSPDGGTRLADDLDTVDPESLAAVAHRVVHGGPRLREAVLLDNRTLAEIESLTELAPLHNAPAVDAARRARAMLPGVPHVAVFDTAFHRSMPEWASAYAVPREWRERYGIRRYGFHGLSVAWAARRAPELLGPDAARRLVVCHLGGGCSVTAVVGGRSVDTTMGFSPLEGVPMATRSGSVDPAAVLYVLRAGGVDATGAERVLNTQSGLLGLTGLQGGMREVEPAAARGDHDARLAFELFVHRVAGAVAAMAAAAGGVDAIVFTAGIGERSTGVRAGVCDLLGFLGVRLSSEANRNVDGDADVTAAGSAVRVLVVRSREELVAAAEARALLTSSAGG